jgi:hypothetical protein
MSNIIFMIEDVLKQRLSNVSLGSIFPQIKSRELYKWTSGLC